MDKLRKILDKTLEATLSILLVIMVIVALWAVISRNVFNNPVTFTTEFLRYALLWLALFAAAYCFGKQAHIAIVFVKEKIKGKALLTLSTCIDLIIIFFAAAVLIYGGMQGIELGMAESSPTLGISVGYVYIALPISGIFIIIYSILNMVDRFRNSDHEDEVDAADKEISNTTM